MKVPMFKFWNVRETQQAPTDGTGGGKSGANEPVVSSGVASPDLMSSLMAAEAASSAAPEPAVGAGDTAQPGGGGSPVAKPAATGQPVVPGTGVVTTPKPAEAPEHRIEAAVRNARAEATRETEARFEAFKGMDPEDVRIGLDVLRELRTDPSKFLGELTARLKGAGGEDEDYPEADIVSKDGSLKTYSDSTFHKALEVHGKRVTAQVMKQLAPFISYAKTEQQRATETEASEAKRAEITAGLTELRTFPHFTKENEPAILMVLQQIPKERRLELGPVRALNLAYNMFLRDSVFPSIETAAEKKVREDNARKAASGGVVHPTQSAGTGEKPVLKNQTDLAAHMERMAAAAAG